MCAARCFPRRWGTWHGPETPSGADLNCILLVCQLGGSKNHLLQGLVHLGSLGTLFSVPKQNPLRSLWCAWSYRDKCWKTWKLNSLCEVGTMKLNEYKANEPTWFLGPWNTVEDTNLVNSINIHWGLALCFIKHIISTLYPFRPYKKSNQRIIILFIYCIYSFES